MSQSIFMSLWIPMPAITQDSAAGDHSGFSCRRSLRIQLSAITQDSTIGDVLDRSCRQLPWTPDFTRPALFSSAAAGDRPGSPWPGTSWVIGYRSCLKTNVLYTIDQSEIVHPWAIFRSLYQSGFVLKRSCRRSPWISLFSFCDIPFFLFWGFNSCFFWFFELINSISRIFDFENNKKQQFFMKVFIL